MTSYETQKGLTLIEILVVLGIIGVILSFSSLVDLNLFKGDIFRSEEYTIISLLEKARSRAMSNMYDSAHGVCYIAPNYVVFRESDGHCANGIASNELTPANANIASALNSNFTANFPTVVFARLAGSTTNATINMTDGVKSATPPITINNEGTINW